MRPLMDCLTRRGPRAALVLATLAGAGPALAQQALPCDQGVVRLGDRAGTVQICSGLAAQVPALAKQLADAVKLLGSQQQQLRELNRLTRALNDSGARLDETRQARLLKSLSAQLGQAEARNPAESRRTLEELGDRFDELRESLLKSRGNAEAEALTRSAMQGALGDAIAQLDWPGTQRQLAGIDARLRQMQADLSEVKGGVTQTNQTLQRIEDSMKVDNAMDHCSDWRCAVSGGGASLKGLQRLADRGARVTQVPNADGALVMHALGRDAAEREPVLKLLLKAGLDQQIRFQPSASEPRVLTPAATALAQAAVERLGTQQSAARSFQGPKLGAWNELAQCLGRQGEGVSVTEVIALLGHEDLLRQALALGFVAPRAALICQGLGLGRPAITFTLALGPGAQARLP